MAMDHNEILAIADMVRTAKGGIPSEEFAQRFLQGVRYMEILHERRVMETPEPPKHPPAVEAPIRTKAGPTPPEKKTPVKQKVYCSIDDDCDTLPPMGGFHD